MSIDYQSRVDREYRLGMSIEGINQHSRYNVPWMPLVHMIRNIRQF